MSNTQRHLVVLPHELPPLDCGYCYTVAQDARRQRNPVTGVGSPCWLNPIPAGQREFARAVGATLIVRVTSLK